MNRFVSSLLLLVLGFAMPDARALAQRTSQKQSLLWEVSGKGLRQSSFLFGTFHMYGKSYFDSLPNVLASLSKSDRVIGEVVFDSNTMTSAFATLMMSGIMTDKTLPELLDPKDYAIAKTKFKFATGFELDMFSQMKPILIYILLAKESLGLSLGVEATETPMDIFFQEEARTQRREVSGLETVPDQARMLFDMIPIEKQVKLLVDHLHEEDNMDLASEEIDRAVRCYSAGDLDCLLSLMGTTSPLDSDVLLHTRNAKWIVKLKTLLQEKRNFVAVGAMHLAGPTGLVAALRDLGYTVTPLPLK